MFKLLQRVLILYVLGTASLLAYFPAASRIETIHSMQEVEQYADQDVFVIFDLDHTIFEAKHYGYGHANWFYDRIEKGKKEGIDEKVTIYRIFPHWLISQKTTQVKPVEALTPALIKKLQKQKIPVMGLTSRQLPLAEISLRQLNSIDIHFDGELLPKETLSWFFKAPAMYKQGVIFCSEYNDKGEVLKAYLDKFNLTPKKILFIDDSRRNLESVIKAYGNQATVVGLFYPLVAEYKKGHWDERATHEAYYEAALSHPELKGMPLEQR